MPKVGDKISFIPSAFMRPSTEMGARTSPVRVKAEITYVNESHRWYLATFSVQGQPMRECFKF